MSLVIAQELSLAYGRKVLLDQPDFVIGPQDRIGLVGANGTGKSSLMKILAGVAAAGLGQAHLPPPGPRGLPAPGHRAPRQWGR